MHGLEARNISRSSRKFKRLSTIESKEKYVPQKSRPNKNSRSKNPSKHKDSKGNRDSTDGWIWGLHAARAAISNEKRKIDRIVATQNAARELTQVPHEIEILRTSDIDSLLPSGTVHQGLAVKAGPLEPQPLEDLLKQAESAETAFIVVLDQVEDPHNVGAILRSAAAFGAIGVVVQDRHAPQLTGALTKVASGAVEHVPIVRVTNLARALEQIAEAGFFRIGLAGEAETVLPDISPSPKAALVLGAEGSGLRRLTREKCDLLARLPTDGPVSSLNVSNAAAVAMYEISR